MSGESEDLLVRSPSRFSFVYFPSRFGYTTSFGHVTVRSMRTAGDFTVKCRKDCGTRLKYCLATYGYWKLDASISFLGVKQLPTSKSMDGRVHLIVAAIARGNRRWKGKGSYSEAYFSGSTERIYFGF